MSTKRRQATRARLLEAGRELMAEIGIQGATVEAICERAGFTRGAFYSNYASKDELILDLFDHEKTILVSLMQAALDAELRPDDDVASMLRAADHFLAAYPRDRTSFLVHQEFVTHGIRGRAVAQVYREVWNETHREFVRIIDHALTVLNRRLTVPLDQAALVLIGAWEMVMREAFLESDDDEADTAAFSQMLPQLLLAFLEPV